MRMLEGKVTLVTGSARGIGAATARSCLVEGAVVVGCDRIEPADLSTEAQGETTRGAGRFIKADIADEDSVDRLFAEIVATYGRLDCLVNNAGIEAPLVETPDVCMNDFDRVMAVNLRGTFLCLRAGLRLMREQKSGSAVNISSVAGFEGINGSIVYNASKHAVVGMTVICTIAIPIAFCRQIRAC